MPISALLLCLQIPAYAPIAPKYVGTSDRVAAAMFGALKSLDATAVKIKSDEGITKIEVLGKRVHETQAGVEWAFDGINLCVRDLRKHIYVTGKCKRHRAIEVVATVTGQRVDIFTRALLLQRAPLQEVVDDSTVRLAGLAAANGEPCDILRADSGGVSTTIFVRRKDHFPASVTTDTSIHGQIMSSSYRAFTFSKLKEAHFVLGILPGEKQQKFPQLQPEKPLRF